MSDREVAACLDQMEGWLRQVPSPCTAEELEAWNQRFQAASATAEHGPDWPALVRRAHALGGAVADLGTAAGAERDRIRLELDQQARGYRALKGYGSATR